MVMYHCGFLATHAKNILLIFQWLDLELNNTPFQHQHPNVHTYNIHIAGCAVSSEIQFITNQTYNPSVFDELGIRL